MRVDVSKSNADNQGAFMTHFIVMMYFQFFFRVWTIESIMMYNARSL